MESGGIVKNVIISVASIILLVAVGLAITYLTQGDQATRPEGITTHGVVHDVNPEGRMLILEEGEITRDAQGEVSTNYTYTAYYWNKNTNFIGGTFRDLAKLKPISITSPKNGNEPPRQALEVVIKH